MSKWALFPEETDVKAYLDSIPTEQRISNSSVLTWRVDPLSGVFQ